MPTFERCPNEVNEMANAILFEFDTHKPLINAKARIDFVFAYCERDEKTGLPVNDALSKNGVKALGIARKIPLKERALGRGDCEISLDGDWWKDASEGERKALLDHELHHFAVKIDKRGIVWDDLSRPVIQIRKHDYDFGWFKIIAERHGRDSQERQQARTMLEESGQYFWPEIERIKHI